MAKAPATPVERPISAISLVMLAGSFEGLEVCLFPGMDAAWDCYCDIGDAHE